MKTFQFCARIYGTYEISTVRIWLFQWQELAKVFSFPGISPSFSYNPQFISSSLRDTGFRDSSILLLPRGEFGTDKQKKIVTITPRNSSMPHFLCYCPRGMDIFLTIISTPAPPQCIYCNVMERHFLFSGAHPHPPTPLQFDTVRQQIPPNDSWPGPADWLCLITAQSPVLTSNTGL